MGRIVRLGILLVVPLLMAPFGAGLAVPILVDGFDAVPGNGRTERDKVVTPQPAPAAPRAGSRAAPRAGVHGAQVLVIGSFRRIGNARRVAERWSKLFASIVPAQIGGVRYYRVVAAPADRNSVAVQKRLLFGGGVPEPWLLPVCKTRRAAKPCVSLPSAIRAWHGKAIAPPGD